MAPIRLEGTGFALNHRIEQYADIGEACRSVRICAGAHREGHNMRYGVRLVGVVFCGLGLLAATPAVQAGPKEDCEQFENRELQIQACSEIIRTEQEAGWAYRKRGFAHELRGDYDKAVADYDEAIRLKPGDGIAYGLRGTAYRLKGDYDRAILDLNESIRLRPTFSLPYFERAYAYIGKGDYDRAIADCNEAMRLIPSSSTALHCRGKAYHGKREYDRAIVDYNEALKLSPKTLLARIHRGFTYEAKGDRDKAIEDFRTALSLPASDKWRRDEQAEAARRLAALQSPPPPLVVPPQAPDSTLGHRVALVIGNSAYSAIERLPNPANDARAVAASFRRLGFAEVIEHRDLSLAAMVEAFKAFGDKAADTDWAIVYYAGHGIEMGGVTYLIPTDARLQKDAHVPDEALPLGRVLAKVETARKLRLVILDACRNNPFLVTMAHVAGAGRSIGRGLGRIEPHGGVIVAYAAKHGTIAQDGSGANSPFTEALLAHLEEPGLEINFLFRKVRDRVLKLTGRAQEPFVYGSLGSEPLYFKMAGAQ